MNIPRRLNIKEEVLKKSCFLFGPRQTGKSWLIRKHLADHKIYNLLESETFLKLNRSPQTLREEYAASEVKDKIIVIDEVQKIPELLNEVHLMMENYGVHFLLTGSSARKLRRGGVNLLGGRARMKHLYPLSFIELQGQFDLVKAVNHGLLPSIYFSNDVEPDLAAYVGTYLKEEIAAEGVTRNVPAFGRFLEVAALCNGQLINYAKIANDAQVSRSTIQEYFQILKDTLIADEVTCWNKTIKRKPLSTSKFYFFDPGVVRILQNRSPIRMGSPEFGEAFETLIYHELKTYSEYSDVGEVCYWRSQAGTEVDFILSDTTAIEVKASKTIGPQDLKSLRFLREEGLLKHYILVCLEDQPRVVDDIQIVPWKMFLEKLWSHAYLKNGTQGLE